METAENVDKEEVALKNKAEARARERAERRKRIAEARQKKKGKKTWNVLQ